MSPINIKISRDLEQIQRRMRRMADEFFGWTGPFYLPRDKSWRPAVDIYETENEIVIVADLAGVGGGDIHVILNRDLLTISGKRGEQTQFQRTRFYQLEIEYGTFQRTFRLPISIDDEDVSATYTDGFLKIILPKKKAKEVTGISVSTE